MNQCQSLNQDDPSVRCSFPRHHGPLSIPNEDDPEELIECAHANPERGAFWDNGVDAATPAILVLTGDEYDALQVILDDHPQGEALIEAIRSRL